MRSDTEDLSSGVTDAAHDEKTVLFDKLIEKTT